MTEAEHQHVAIREISTNERLKVPETTEMLRVPYDAHEIEGPARLDGDTVVYQRKGETLLGQVKRGYLSETSPGERVLVPDHIFAKDRPAEPTWWLCEVEAVGGDDYA